MDNIFYTEAGSPFPLGLSHKGQGMNFSVVSASAKEITLSLFNRDTREQVAAIPLSPLTNKTGNIWHILITQLPTIPLAYAFQLSPPFKKFTGYLLDPYAKNLATPHVWGQHISFGAQENSYHPLGDLLPAPAFDWGGDAPPGIPLNQLLIYEMHVRGFTQHSSSRVKHPGTFLGIIEKIPYLLDLGINAVELLPIHEFNENEYQHSHPQNKKWMFNYWGYSTVNFFTPMNRYASSDEPGAACREFKMMVRELHRHGIEVILDVVFNHTAEGNETGPVLSFKGFDNAVYYILANGKYFNSSGCGNTVNANHPVVASLIIDALRYWVLEMHVDGFRFDLASAMMRGTHGEPLLLSPIIQAITYDPVLANVKLIAEPWDIGLYQVGSFAPETKRWSEWNGKYRDAMRRFIKGVPGTSGEFAMRLCGSEDLYKMRGPQSSINFITAHDGFTLADLVSYNSKHNLENGEHNQDGTNDNESWNCGEEGPATNPKTAKLRAQQMRNLHLALMLSQGVPMLLMADEYGHTKKGNNNTWCQDNELNWFLWDQLAGKEAFYRFYTLLIKFRKEHMRLFARSSFLQPKDIDWHGCQPFRPEWNKHGFVAFTLKDPVENRNLYAAFNAQNHSASVRLPPPPPAKQWRWVVNTSNPPPLDIYENHEGPLVKDDACTLPAFSAILLEAT